MLSTITYALEIIEQPGGSLFLTRQVVWFWATSSGRCIIVVA